MTESRIPQPLTFPQFLQRTAAWRAGGVALGLVVVVWALVRAWWRGLSSADRLAFVNGSVGEPSTAALLIALSSGFIALGVFWVTHGLYRQQVARYSEEARRVENIYETRPEVRLARELCTRPYSYPLQGTAGVRDLGMFFDVLAEGLAWDGQPVRYGSLSSLEDVHFGCEIRRSTPFSGAEDTAPFAAIRWLETRLLVEVDGRADEHDSDEDRCGIDAKITITALGSQVLSHVRTFLAERT